MPVSTVRVEGLKELNRALKNVSKDLQKEMRTGLKKAAEPVAVDARHRAMRYGPRVAAGIAAGSRTGGAVVRQRNKKTTGKRPDFGVLQMDAVLIPALAAKSDEVLKAVEDMIDKIADKEGF